MILTKHHDPARQVDINLMYRELIEHFPQHTGYILLRHIGGAERHHRNIVFQSQLTPELLCFLTARPGRVDHKHKRLADLLQFSNHTLF
ncbi:hypothetical protein D3C81_1398050 [compost metagenome]